MLRENSSGLPSGFSAGEGRESRGRNFLSEGGNNFYSPKTASSVAAPLTIKGGQRRRLLGRLVQLLMVLVVLLPLWLLASSHIGMAAQGKDQSDSGNRKLMNRPLLRHMLPAARLRNLVLVAGHAVYVGSNYAEARVQDSWFLEEYQRVPGEVESFLDHIRIGIEEAAADPLALLLFSGGQTRLAAGPRSEGLSYWVVAEAGGWFNHTEVRGRAFTEEHARDSFENMLFGMCRFYELTGHYPQSVTIVSYTLKQQRFETLHRAAMRFPHTKFKFVGTPIPPAATGASAGEAMTVASFKTHPYGCDGDLMLKRLRRDPFAVGPIHPSRCPDLRALLGHCSDELFTGPLPWDDGRHLHAEEADDLS